MNGSARQPLDAAIAAGDDQEFASLLERHYGPMLRLAKAIVADERAAVAGVRRAWEVALRDQEPADGFPSLKAWLFSLVQAELEDDPLTRDWDDVEDIDPSPFEREDDRWAGHWRDQSIPLPWTRESIAADGNGLAQLLCELPSMHAVMLVLHDVEQLSDLEITALLGLMPDSQLALLHSARTMLRSAIDRRTSRSDALQ